MRTQDILIKKKRHPVGHMSKCVKISAELCDKGLNPSDIIQTLKYVESSQPVYKMYDLFIIIKILNSLLLKTKCSVNKGGLCLWRISTPTGMALRPIAKIASMFC